MEWDEIDERTFISFWQFVYTGNYDNPESLLTTVSNVIASNDYSHEKADDFDTEAAKGKPAEEPEPEPAPEPEPEPEPEPAPEPEPEPEPEPATDDDWVYPTEREEEEKTKRAKREMLWDDFQESWRLELPSRVNDETREAQETSTDLAYIFVHHARVYILGDRYVHNHPVDECVVP